MSRRNRFVVSVALVAGLVGGWAAGDALSGEDGESRTTMVPATSSPITRNDRRPYDPQADCGGSTNGLTTDQIRACL